jgi:hypothetical protein
MPWKYNPFTDALDNVGSGGGSYIDGEVEYHSNLPVTVGTPAVNSAFLVRKGEGVYFISRKPAGIWVRELNNGNLDDWKYAGTFSDLYRDANFRILNNADVTKELAFDVSGVTTGTTRTLTAPNASGTIARTQDFAAPPAIGNTTPAAGSFTTLSATPAANTTALTSTGYSLTGSNAQSLIDLSGTWNTTGVPIALKTNLTVTAAGSNSMYADFQAGGYSQFGVARISGTSNALWLYNANSGTNTNGIGANYERGSLGWVSNRFSLIVEAAGSGTARGALIRVGTGQSIILDADTHEFRSAGFTQRLAIQSSGVVVYASLLQFGGTTSSFPALKRSSTVLQARLANDSDFCPLQGQIRIHQNAVAETPTATHTMTLFDAAGTAYKVLCVAA